MTEQQKTVRLPQYLAALAAACGAFCAGTALGWSSPAGPRLIDDQQQGFPISVNEFSWIASVFTIGAACSCLSIGYLMKKFGRKWSMIGLYVPFIIGWALLIWAQNFAMMLIGRFILGLAGGAFFIAAPQYSAEIAEKEIRGILGSFLLLMSVLGILYVYVFGAFLTILWINIACWILPFIFAAIFICMPESPVYLVIESRPEDAAKSLKWLRGKSYDPRNEIEDMKNYYHEKERKILLKDTIRKPSTVAAIIISIGLQYFQQTTGFNVVLFYATTIFGVANVGMSIEVATLILGGIIIISAILSLALIDRLGRRILLITSIIGMTLSLFALGTYFFVKDSDEEAAKNFGWLPLTSLCSYIIFYNFGYGPGPWLVMSEVMSQDTNVIFGPIVGAFSWSMAFLITFTFNNITELIGIGQTFWLFGSLSAVGILFTFFVIPETKGKSLEEIQKMLTHKTEKLSQ